MLQNILIGLALMIIGYMLMPKPAVPKREITEMEGPTADAGRKVPVLIGDKTIKDPNYLWWGEKAYVDRMDKSGSGGKKSK